MDIRDFNKSKDKSRPKNVLSPSRQSVLEILRFGNDKQTLINLDELH